MPDGRYDRDPPSWSEHQADPLRRLARGERVNDVDWMHIVEKIEDLGLCELHAVESLLDLMLVHLLNLHGWPDSPSVDHWRAVISSLQKHAPQRLEPSMQQRIDIAKLRADAAEQLEGVHCDNVAARPPPAACPFTLDALFGEKRSALEQALRYPVRRE